MAHCAALLALVVVLVACDGPKPPKTARVAEAAERTVVSLGTATPLHPGVRRDLREAGLLQ
jgi:hypothetical protein